MKETNHRKPISTITGTVIHGRGIGKLVGTPTANIAAEGSAALPDTGVYISAISLDHQTYYGITHIGRRPTLDNDQNLSIETHIFGFHNDIYGSLITVSLYKKLREVKQFSELSLLIEQIERDCLAAQSFWGIPRECRPLYLDSKRHCAMIGRQEIYLSANEFKLLHLLYRSPQTAFTKPEIYEQVWQAPANDHLHAVENTVFQIRKRLKPYCGGHEYIKTVVGYGYKFNPA